jgi:N-acetylmuramoyl-L-alanine amidase
MNTLTAFVRRSLFTILNIFGQIMVLAFVLSSSVPADGSPQSGSETRTIVIDPGHGGTIYAGSDAAKTKSTDNNATSLVHHIKEKDVALQLSKLIAYAVNNSDEARAKQVKAILTRNSDVNLDFAKRAEVAAKAHAVCYVAIHFNSDDHGHRATGPRALIQRQSKNPNYAADEEFGMALATAVEKVSRKFRPETPKASCQNDKELHGNWGSYLFHQLNENSATRLIPSCHLEVEFLDNSKVEALFFVEQRDKIFAEWAAAIAQELMRQATL